MRKIILLGLIVLLFSGCALQKAAHGPVEHVDTYTDRAGNPWEVLRGSPHTINTLYNTEYNGERDPFKQVAEWKYVEGFVGRYNYRTQRRVRRIFTVSTEKSRGIVAHEIAHVECYAWRHGHNPAALRKCKWTRDAAALNYVAPKKTHIRRVR